MMRLKNEQYCLENLTTQKVCCSCMHATIVNDIFKGNSDNWSHETVINTIKATIINGCNIPPPNVIILKPGGNPNCNTNVHAACKMYFDDVSTENSGYINIVCDEAL